MTLDGRKSLVVPGLPSSPPVRGEGVGFFASTFVKIDTIPFLPYLVAGFVSLLLASSIEIRAQQPSPPNFLLIFTDDQGLNDVSCYGSEISTPNIDSLAREGLKFNSWYVASSICTPSRFGLLTGRNPSRSKDQLLGALMFLTAEDKTRGIQSGETTIAEVLRDSGYLTALIGKWHLGHGSKTKFWPTRHGFDSFYGHTGGCVDYFTGNYGNLPDWYRNEDLVDGDGYSTDLLTDEAVRFLRAQRDGKPFFLNLSYNAPHFGKGWNSEDKKTENIMQPRAKELSLVKGIDGAKRREFAAMTLALDVGIGRVLNALEDSGLADNTLVIFMTDNGGDPVYGGSNLPFRGNKATLFEGGIRVPCLMRWPGRIAAGTTTDSVGSALDIFPTFCALAGVDASNYTLDGQNLKPLLIEGRTAERELFWELGSHAELERGQWTALRRGKWKYVSTASNEEFLFQLHSDPHESKNLANNEVKLFSELRLRSSELREKFHGNN